MSTERARAIAISRGSALDGHEARSRPVLVQQADHRLLRLVDRPRVGSRLRRASAERSEAARRPRIATAARRAPSANEARVGSRDGTAGHADTIARPARRAVWARVPTGPALSFAPPVPRGVARCDATVSAPHPPGPHADGT